MAIAIPTSAAIDIENYDGLIAFIIEHLELDAESAAQVPTFIRMAEYRLNRMLTHPERETSATLTTTADIDFVALPADFVQARYVRIDQPLAPITRGAFNSEESGEPTGYTISQQSIYLCPTPDGEYNISLTYLAKLAQLSSASQTNWLLADHADAYVYATLMQAESFLGHDKRVAFFNEALEMTMAEINAAGLRYRTAGGIKLRNPVCA